MVELEDKLVKCFTSVFPDLTAEQIRAARVGSVPGWDSIATVTLLAVIQEEFGVDLDLERLPELTFAAIKNDLSNI